ncbi:MAG: hypothetical protein R2770_18040 [Acidimicrobiales bacterium]
MERLLGDHEEVKSRALAGIAVVITVWLWAGDWLVKAEPVSGVPLTLSSGIDQLGSGPTLALVAATAALFGQLLVRLFEIPINFMTRLAVGTEWPKEREDLGVWPRVLGLNVDTIEERSDSYESGIAFRVALAVWSAPVAISLLLRGDMPIRGATIVLFILLAVEGALTRHFVPNAIRSDAAKLVVRRLLDQHHEQIVARSLDRRVLSSAAIDFFERSDDDFSALRNGLSTIASGTSEQIVETAVLDLARLTSSYGEVRRDYR